MKRRSFLLAYIFFSCSLYAQSDTTTSYRYFVDLSSISNDRMQVELLAPRMKGTTGLFRFPVMVPGTYAIYDFGRFVSGITATDSAGNLLITEKIDVNTWKISDIGKLYRITYTTDDTYDADTNNFVFEPAGTNYEAGENIVLNASSYLGYFEGYTKIPYELSVKHPVELYGSTSLIPVKAEGTRDVFRTATYNELVDAPIMYNRPDTTIMQIGGAEILVSVYSPGKKMSSVMVAAQVREILNAAKDYLGGSLPIKKYAFIIYLSASEQEGEKAYGALEHSYSSMYFLPDSDPENIGMSIRDISAHEFYHIITPLTIHSEEIGNFDFNQPRMSKHLWLYEGVTEYTATYVQLRQGLLKPEDYFKVIRYKIMNSRRNYNDSLAFTDLSKYALDTHKDQYANVYEKGALIGFCLDVKLRSLSGGSYGIQNLMNDLALKYGKDKSFRDGVLFREITALTYPEIGEFFERYVAGSEPLPLEETFRLIGYDYKKSMSRKGFSFGMTNYYSLNNQILVVFEIDDMGRLLDLRRFDQILSINGEDMTGTKPLETHTKLYELKTNWLKNVEEGDKLKIKVIREGKKKTLKAKVTKVDIFSYEVITPDPNATALQLKIRKAWLGR